MCSIFHIAGVLLGLCCSASLSSHSSPEKWLDGGRANGRWSSRLFELPTHSSAKPDNIHWLFKHYSLIRVCHHQVCSVTAPVRTERRARNTFNPVFKNHLYIRFNQDGNLLFLLTSGSLLMHLLTEESFLCLTMDKVAVMKSDTPLHLEDDRRAEERSRLDCVNLPQSSLADGDNTDLLRCQDVTENSSPVKYRRYGYALLCLSWRYFFFMAWWTV